MLSILNLSSRIIKNSNLITQKRLFQVSLPSYLAKKNNGIQEQYKLINEINPFNNHTISKSEDSSDIPLDTSSKSSNKNSNRSSTKSSNKNNSKPPNPLASNPNVQKKKSIHTDKTIINLERNFRKKLETEKNIPKEEILANTKEFLQINDPYKDEKNRLLTLNYDTLLNTEIKLDLTKEIKVEDILLNIPIELKDITLRNIKNNLSNKILFPLLSTNINPFLTKNWPITYERHFFSIYCILRKSYLDYLDYLSYRKIYDNLLDVEDYYRIDNIHNFSDIFFYHFQTYNVSSTSLSTLTNKYFYQQFLSLITNPRFNILFFSVVKNYLENPTGLKNNTISLLNDPKLEPSFVRWDEEKMAYLADIYFDGVLKNKTFRVSKTNYDDYSNMFYEKFHEKATTSSIQKTLKTIRKVNFKRLQEVYDILVKNIENDDKINEKTKKSMINSLTKGLNDQNKEKKKHLGDYNFDIFLDWIILDPHLVFTKIEDVLKYKKEFDKAKKLYDKLDTSVIYSRKSYLVKELSLSLLKNNFWLSAQVILTEFHAKPKIFNWSRFNRKEIFINLIKKHFPPSEYPLNIIKDEIYHQKSNSSILFFEDLMKEFKLVKIEPFNESKSFKTTYNEFFTYKKFCKKLKEFYPQLIELGYKNSF